MTFALQSKVLPLCFGTFYGFRTFKKKLFPQQLCWFTIAKNFRIKD